MIEADDNYERVLRLCEHMSSGRDFFSRADMDELALRVEAAKTKFPKRFVDLVREKDETYFRNNDDDWRELSARLRRILELSDELKLEKAFFDDETELLPTFALSGDDRLRVLTLCGEMRKIVFGSTVFDSAHKRRLSNRISAIEKQVHQERGLFDVILGGLSDVGEALGKFGNDVKPLTDRMAEVAKITRDATEEYDSLPPPPEQKRLPPPD